MGEVLGEVIVEGVLLREGFVEGSGEMVVGGVWEGERGWRMKGIDRRRIVGWEIVGKWIWGVG